MLRSDGGAFLFSSCQPGTPRQVSRPATPYRERTVGCFLRYGRRTRLSQEGLRRGGREGSTEGSGGEIEGLSLCAAQTAAARGPRKRSTAELILCRRNRPSHGAVGSFLKIGGSLSEKLQEQAIP
jgi:hypothetical protein